MTLNLYDTSAITKHYQPELGSAKVDGLLGMIGCTQSISELTIVEFHSALAKKVRMGKINMPTYSSASRLFNADLLTYKLTVIPITASDFLTAKQLINRISLSPNLRTLDALQLAVALDLYASGQSIEFVTADQALCTIAQAEGLSVINPEIP